MNLYQETVVELLEEKINRLTDEIAFSSSIPNIKLLELELVKLQETLDIVLNDKLHLQD